MNNIAIAAEKFQLGDVIYLSSTGAAYKANAEESYVHANLSDGITNIEPRLDVKNFSDETIAALRKALDYGDVVVKCGHCGQWGAVKTACKHCGAPVG